MGANLDLKGSWNEIGLWDFVLLFMIHANVPHGPDSDDLRHHQLRSAMQQAYHNLDESTPLFASVASDIHAQLRDSGHSWPGDDNAAKEVWSYCKSQDPCSNKGYHLNLNRFQGTVQRAGECLGKWALDKWERTYLCLELDWLHGAGVRRLVLRPGPVESTTEEGRTSTSTALVTLEDRSLRACMQRAMVASCLFLNRELNRRRWSIWYEVGAIGKEWHGQQSHELLPKDVSVKWLIDQVAKGGFFNRMNLLAGAVSNESLLLRCGFTIPHSVDSVPDLNDVTLQDNEMAAILGQLSLALYLARQRRCLWFLLVGPTKWCAF